jgi:DNA-binding MarR family transcriptional regulator
VEKRADESDRRTSRIHPTAQGAAEHAAISDAWAGSVEDALAGLAPAQREALAAASDAMAALARAMREQPR